MMRGRDEDAREKCLHVTIIVQWHLATDSCWLCLGDNHDQNWAPRGTKSMHGIPNQTLRQTSGKYISQIFQKWLWLLSFNFFSEGHKNCRSINHAYFWCHVEPSFDHGCPLNKFSKIPLLDVTARLLSHANIFLVNLYLLYLPYLRHYKPQFIYLL